MSEYWVKYEDWSLEAVVKGASGAFSKIVDGTNYMYPCYVDHRYQQELAPDHSSFAAFPVMSKSCFNELEEVYKPFYPVAHSQNNGLEIGDTKQMVKHHDPILARKYKRRKKYKKVVMHVSAKDLASHDQWAWRKYGQKPIKCSPFPRSYYRCSSSKDCLARKQVEQSYKVPGMFIVTYSANHCHGHPTKRSSLAGTVRPRYASNSTTTTTTTTGHVSLQTRHEDQAMKVKEEGKQRDNSSIDGHFGMPRDLMFDIDDFYQGLEDTHEFVPEHSIIC